MKKKLFYLLLVILAATAVSMAQNAVDDSPEAIKIEPNPSQGFSYPYYLYVPTGMRKKVGNTKSLHTLLVIPNNSGILSDDSAAQEADVRRRIKQNIQIADRLGVALLMPVFPRPQSDWKIYTHALDRDAMTTDKKELARFDLQLISMIDDVRAKLAKEKLKFDKRVLMFGFSASAMFANRFTFLHPQRVKACAVGSPGGWAIAPIVSFEKKDMRYPIGISDLKLISGEKFKLKKLRKVPMFMFLGSADENDSVIFRDSYEKEDEDLIFSLFGKTPVERWSVSKKLYRDNNLNAEFRVYRNVKHSVTKEMLNDVLEFFRKSMK